MTSERIKEKTAFADPFSDLFARDIPSAPVRAPLTAPHLPYRAKTPLARHRINPLTANAAGLFALASRLHETTDYQDIKTLAKHLVHEIKAFEVNTQKQNCDPN